MTNALIEDEKRTSDLNYGELTIWKITKIWDEWNAREALALERHYGTRPIVWYSFNTLVATTSSALLKMCRKFSH
jgi:hypothetical protein